MSIRHSAYGRLAAMDSTTRLKSCDVRALLECLRTVYGLCDLSAFADRVLQAISKLIPSDFIGYRAMDPLETISRGRYWPSDHPSLPEDQIWTRHMHEHPVLTQNLRTGEGRARKISDFLTRHQFHQLGLYWEIYRTVRVEDVLAIQLAVAAPGGIGISFHRQSPIFSERERWIADQLR